MRIIKIGIGFIISYIILLLITTGFSFIEINNYLLVYIFFFLLLTAFCIIAFKKVEAFLRKRNFKSAFFVRILVVIILSGIIAAIDYYADAPNETKVKIIWIMWMPIAYLISQSLFHSKGAQEDTA